MGETARLSFARWRNRLISSPRVRALASWFPPARRPAQRYARTVFDITAGFVYSQVAHAIVESGLLTRLLQGPISLEEAAGRAGLSEPATLTLLKAAASIDLVETHGDHFIAGATGAALAATPGLAEMIGHHRLLYQDLADPLALLRAGRGRLADLWRYDSDADPAEVARYSALMAATQPMIAEQAIAAYSFTRHRRMLDIGGGLGGFIGAVARIAPDLKFGLLDRPEVLSRASPSLSATLHPGSFEDPLPCGYDLITLVRILHDHDDPVVERLLPNVRAALPAQGRVLIVEPLAETRAAAPMGHGYFGLYLTAMGSGRPRSFSEYRAMLTKAGFRKVRRCATPVPLIASVIVAET
jgi:demethylspheroidene O-methyltransferase